MFKLDEIIDILDYKNGMIKIDEKLNIKNISTDSRTINKGDLFIPLKGENFDGHDYINLAFKNGAVFVISEKEVNYPSIIVNDAKKAYLRIAEYYREKINPIVIAITGSVGKTTTKEFIASVLEEKILIKKTFKNLNNEIGVAKTILKLNKKHKVLVIELGMDHFGDMTILSKMVRPDYVVLTNIGLSHVGNFNSKEEILEGKFQIFDYIKNNGKVIYNGDDKSLITNINRINYKKYSFGFNSGNKVRCLENISKGINGNRIKVKTKKDNYFFNTKALGTHLGYSILPAVIIGEIFGLKNNEIKIGIESYLNKDKRMEIVKKGNVTIINDTYNASLISMKSAIDTLIKSEINGEKIAFLADILELGGLTKEIHTNLGKYLNNKNIDKVIFYGRDIKYAYDFLKSSKYGNIYYFNNKDDIKKNIRKFVKEDSLVLLKGSRGMKMEEIIGFI